MGAYWRYFGLGLLLVFLIVSQLPYFDVVKDVAFLVVVGGFLLGGFLWGCKQLVGALLLHKGRVSPNDFWGYTPLGQLLSGLGLLGGEGLILWSLSGGEIGQTHLVFVLAFILLVGAGVVIESRSEQRLS